MLEALEEPIRRLLRVPPEPDPPAGSARSVRVFRAAPGFYRYRLLAWAFKQTGALASLLVGFGSLRFFQEHMAGPAFILRWLPLAWLDLFEYLAIAGFVLQLPASFLLVALDYRYRWYVTTDRSLRIREGLWKVHEKTMTFSNVQNVEIRQGPLQRRFGIADLRVQTAGGGGEKGEEEGSSAADLHVGYFRGVANPAEIRDGILARLRRLRASGLGDPDEPPPAERPAAPDRSTAEAAREVLRQTRALAGELLEP